MVGHIAIDDGENLLHRLVHHALGHAAVAHRLGQLRVGGVAQRRHGQIHARQHALDVVGARAPVGHGVAVEAPLVAQQIAQQPAVLAGIHAADLVVGAHDRPGLGLAHGLFKAGEVDFAHGALVGLHADAQAAMLLIVHGEVLQARAHIAALHAPDVRRGHLARQIGILGEVLEVPAAQRRALDVRARAEDDGHVLLLTQIAQRLTHLIEQLAVKGAGRGRRRGKGRGRHRRVQAQMIRARLLLAQAVRAVRHHHRRHAQPLHALQMPEILSVEQRRLFLQRHLRDDFLNIHRLPPANLR